MTDDNRPMDPERLALMKTLIARTEVRHWAYVADAVDPVGVAEMLGELAEELLRAHDHHDAVSILLAEKLVEAELERDSAKDAATKAKAERDGARRAAVDAANWEGCDDARDVCEAMFGSEAAAHLYPEWPL